MLDLAAVAVSLGAFRGFDILSGGRGSCLPPTIQAPLLIYIDIGARFMARPYRETDVPAGA